MAKYILIKRLNVLGACGLQDEHIVGVPAMTQHNGFVDSLRRSLNGQFKIKIEGFTIAYHYVDFDNVLLSKYNYVGYRTHREATARTTLDSKLIADYVDKPKVNMTISYLLKVKTSIDEEDIVKSIMDFLKTARVCGGFVDTSKPPRIEVIVSNNCDKDKIILKKLMPSQIPITRTDLILNSKLSPLETEVRCMTYTPNEPKTGWLVPMVVGYKKIGECVSKDNLHNQEVYGCLGEAISTVCEFVMPYKFNLVDDCLWHSECTDDNKYLIVDKNYKNA